MTDIEISNDKYINANEFYKKCKQDYYDGAVDFDFLITELAEMPKADVVEVVRCKDCKYSVEYVSFYLCFKSVGGVAKKADEFCDCGERKKTKCITKI